INYREARPEIFTSRENDGWADRVIRENGLTGRPIAGVIAGGGRSWGDNSRFRRWPVENFARVSDRISGELGLNVILLGDHKEAELCGRMRALMSRSALNMGGKTDVGQFMALVKKCSFILCNEGGPLHIAVGLRVPTVSLFGPVDEMVYGPFSHDPSRHIVVTADVACRPCYARFKHKKCDNVKCLHSISDEKVFDAVSVLAGRVGVNARN
ncbi:MAG: glycosyltransferase family 9 protein, partial [Candidatus Omnitrophota bacterium]